MSAPVLAALALEIDPAGGAPDEAHLLPRGPFRATDGRPRDIAAWQLDDAIAAQVIARAAVRRGDILIDYEHQSLNAGWNGQPAPAAGWFRALEFREAGLYAIGVKWTDRAAQMIAAREYRYISAVFEYLPSTGEVLEIVSVALTNTPALDGLDALVAARRLDPITKEDADMAETPELAALKTECDALKTSVATLTRERDAATAELAALKAQAAEAALAADRAAHTAALEAAVAEGIVPPAERAIYEKMPLADLKAAIEARKPFALLSSQAVGRAPATAALTAEEATLCEKLGVTPEQFRKAQEA